MLTRHDALPVCPAGQIKSSSLRSRPHPPSGHLLPQAGEGLRLLSANERQVDAGHSTAAFAVGQRRVAVMQLRYLRNETQAQATTAAAAVGPPQRVEAFEHATDGLVRYARDAIGHPDGPATGLPQPPAGPH